MIKVGFYAERKIEFASRSVRRMWECKLIRRGVSFSKKSICVYI